MVKLESCCEWQEHLMGRVTCEGISIIPVLEHGVRQFILQVRMLDEGVKLYLSGDKRNPKGVTLVSWLPLTYCPRCGASMDKLIGSQKKVFDDAAKAVKCVLLGANGGAYI